VGAHALQSFRILQGWIRHLLSVINVTKMDRKVTYRVKESHRRLGTNNDTCLSTFLLQTCHETFLLDVIYAFNMWGLLSHLTARRSSRVMLELLIQIKYLETPRTMYWLFMDSE
jgi:hypothetical protein